MMRIARKKAKSDFEAESNTSKFPSEAEHLAKARELTRRAVDSSLHSDSKEVAAIWYANAALREAAEVGSGEGLQ